MKRNASSKLLITSLAIVFFSILLGLVANLLTSDAEFGQWLKDRHIGMRELIIGVVILGTGSLIFTYFQFRYSQQTEQTSEKENSPKDIESDVKRFYDSLKERYLKRYESKLDGRFEITLEVSENWDGEDTKNFKGEYEGKGQISEAFEYINSAFEKQGRLLIVGSPGVGKTVLLLKLALELLEKADIQKKEAFPVIFNLASWSNKYENFDDWLISVLNSGEGLSKDFAGKLLKEERIIFLLDGLDELARNEDEETAARKRAKCLQSLNDYLDRGKKVIICCRVNEFELLRTLTGKSAPVSAKVKVNDLSEVEVLNTLMKVKEDKTDKTAATNLLKILENDENDKLLKVLRTPFYFTTALEVFDKQIFEDIYLPKNVRDLKNYLRRNFIGKKLNKTLNPHEFDEEKTKKWLKHLAKLINSKKLITFELADLQPSDIAEKWKFGLIYGAVTGLFFSLVSIISIGLVAGLFLGLVVGVVFSLGLVLIDDLIGGLFGSFVGRLTAKLFYDIREIKTEDIISLDFLKLSDWNYWKEVLFFSLIYGLVSILFLNLIVKLDVSLTVSLGLTSVSILIIGFDELKSIKGFSNLENPYQRIKGGFLTNLYFSFLLILILIMGKTFLEFYPKNETNGLTNSLNLLVTMFLYLPGLTLLYRPLFRHFVLRLCLYIEDKMPLNYVAFLNYAAEARILEKDGGQWRFRHQNLQDYFAGLDERSVKSDGQVESPMR